MFTQFMHKIRNIILLFCLYNVSLLAQQDIIHISMFGEDSIKSDFFKKWYHQGDLVYYLEALNDHTIVENHTTGQWWLPDRLVIGVEGNSFFWNLRNNWRNIIIFKINIKKFIFFINISILKISLFI